jgi:hypothetical protein
VELGTDGTCSGQNFLEKQFGLFLFFFGEKCGVVELMVMYCVYLFKSGWSLKVRIDLQPSGGTGSGQEFSRKMVWFFFRRKMWCRGADGDVLRLIVQNSWSLKVRIDLQPRF